MKFRFSRLFAALALVFGAMLAVEAQTIHQTGTDITIEEVWLEMPGGVKLAADIYASGNRAADEGMAGNDSARLSVS
jgi:hypothetical protein